MERLIKVIESVRADLPDVFEKNTAKTGRPQRPVIGGQGQAQPPDIPDVLKGIWPTRDQQMNEGELRALKEIVEYNEQEYTDLRGRLNKDGIEALAWYVPFHFLPYEGRWGIYYDEKKIVLLANDFLRRDGLPITDLLRYVREIFLALTAHELFHFRTEFFSLIVEQFSHRPMHLPYFYQVYQMAFLTRDCLEESLANATLSQLRISREVRNNLQELYRSLPAGYRHFERFMGREHVQGIAKLTAQVLECGINSRRDSYFSWFPGRYDKGPGDLWNVPRYLIIDKRISSNIRSLIFRS